MHKIGNARIKQYHYNRYLKGSAVIDNLKFLSNFITVFLWFSDHNIRLEIKSGNLQKLKTRKTHMNSLLSGYILSWTNSICCLVSFLSFFGGIYQSSSFNNPEKSYHPVPRDSSMTPGLFILSLISARKDFRSFYTDSTHSLAFSVFSWLTLYNI